MSKDVELFMTKEDVNIVENNDTTKNILIEDLSTQEAINDFARGIIPETFARDYKRLKRLQDELSKTEAEIKEKLLEMFKEHPEMNGKTVSMDGLKFTYVKPFNRTTVDSKKLQEEWPDIYKKVIKTTSVKDSIKTYVEY